MHDFLNEMSRKRQRTYVWSRWLTLAVVILLAIALLLTISGRSHANPPPGATLVFSEWFKAQKQMDNPYLAPCCGGPTNEGGDGHYVNVKHEGGKWFVYVAEIQSWEEYPRQVDPDLDNPTGKSVAWYLVNADGSITWYCLRISIGA